MPTETPAAPKTSKSARRNLGRRLLGSSLVDALAGVHGVDGFLEQVKPTWSVRSRRAEVIDVRRMTPDSVTLRLRPNATWEGHRAGQFIQIGIEIDGVRRTRCYSPASAEAGGGAELEITVKRHPEGRVSNHLIERAHTGMIVELSAADGDFALPAERPEAITLISGGSGITPVMSMLRTLCAEGHSGAITFLHYAPEPKGALYARELERIAAEHPNVRVLRSYTRSKGEGDLDGHFSRSHVRALGKHAAEAITFACGPVGLLNSVREAAQARGAEDRLRIESFVPPALAAASGEAEGVIKLVESGLELKNSGATLLDQAEEAGLTPETGCRMGICKTCTCRKTAGVVRNLQTGELSSGEDEEIQICVSAPVGDVSIEL